MGCVCARLTELVCPYWFLMPPNTQTKRKWKQKKRSNLFSSFKMNGPNKTPRHSALAWYWWPELSRFLVQMNYLVSWRRVMTFDIIIIKYKCMCVYIYWGNGRVSYEPKNCRFFTQFHFYTHQSHSWIWDNSIMEQQSLLLLSLRLLSLSSTMIFVIFFSSSF